MGTDQEMLYEEKEIRLLDLLNEVKRIQAKENQYSLTDLEIYYLNTFQYLQNQVNLFSDLSLSRNYLWKSEFLVEKLPKQYVFY